MGKKANKPLFISDTCHIFLIEAKQRPGCEVCEPLPERLTFAHFPRFVIPVRYLWVMSLIEAIQVKRIGIAKYVRRKGNELIWQDAQVSRVKTIEVIDLFLVYPTQMPVNSLGPRSKKEYMR